MTSRSRLASAVRQLLGTLAAAIARAFGGSGAPAHRSTVSACLATAAERAQRLASVGLRSRMSLATRRLPVFGLASLFAITAALAIATPAAMAGTVAPLLSTTGGFSAPLGVAIDPSSQEVYVADAGTGAVDQFDSSGSPPFTVTPFGSGFTTPRAIAVDSLTGDVYVADNGNDAVYEFDSSGSLISTITGPPFSNPLAVAVDPSTGDVYVADNGNEAVYEFDSSGSLISTITGPPGGFSNPRGVAVDSLTGDTYVSDSGNNVVYQFDSSGNLLFTITGPTGGFTDPTGVAVDSSNGDLAVADGAGVVYIFGPAVVVPDVTTGQASSVSPTGATLNGTVNPDGTTITDCHFDYVDDADYSPSAANPYSAGATAACASTPSGSSPTPVSADVTGLTPGTGYHFRLEASNANGTTYGLDEIFGSPQVDGQSSANVTQATATLQAQVNPDSADSSCQFEYVDAADYNPSTADPYSAGQTVACSPADLGAGSGDVSASADITGLTAGTTYHWRTVATNVSGTVDGTDQTLTTGPALTIDSASASNLTASSATLNAQINPLGTDTTYHFEYGSAGPCSSNPCTSVPIPDADIGSGTSDVAVTQQLTGLSANTEYHWRVVATNSLAPQGVDSPDHTFVYPIALGGPDTCPNAAFRQGPSADLPDCRAYELVTPPFKQGGRPNLDGVSPDGSSAIISSLGNFGCAANNQTTYGAYYESTRTASGWSTACLDPPASQFPWDQFLDATPDLGKTLWKTRATAQSLLALDLTVRNRDGTLQDLGPVEPPAATSGAPGTGSPQGNQISTKYGGASTDLSRVFFTIESNTGAGNMLWPGDNTAPGGLDSLYEYVAGRSGPPALVGVDNNGSQLSECGVRPGAGFTFLGSTSHSVSADGSTVFFTAAGADNGSCSGSEPAVSQLYARIGAPGSTQATVNVAGSSGCGASASCDVTSPPIYQGAAADGSKVFFTDGSDLYECDLPGDSGPTPTPVAVVDPCPDLRAISGTGADVQSVAAISDDGSHVYFVADGVLTSTPNKYGAAASQGANNLYLYERDAAFPSGHVAFIGALSSSSPLAKATPDGRFLAFNDSAQLTPDDTSSAQQVFRYDAQTGELVRVSIGQDGFNDNGNTNTYAATIAVTGNTEVMQEPLTISDDGAYVVFQSADGLTPQALNGEMTDTPGLFANNVYEYHDGEVQLISDGRDATSNDSQSSVQAQGTTAAGADVFFTTGDQLVPQDTDTQQDIYDARIDGGFPPSAAPPSCQGDACQGVPSATPAPPVAGSISFSGPGNASPGAALTPKVRITKKSVTGSTFVLRVRVPGKGRITASGGGVKTIRRSVSKAGTYTLKLGLTAKERTRLKRLKRGKKLKLKLRVSYAPASGTRSTATVSVTVKA